MPNEQFMILLFSSILTIFFLIIALYFTILFVKVLLKYRKEKQAKALLEKGYKIETVDQDGIPHLMRRGNYVDNVFKIMKKEKKQS